MNRHTNFAALEHHATHLIRLCGRIQENELWVEDAFKRSLLDIHIREHITELANWIGCELVQRECKIEEAA